MIDPEEVIRICAQEAVVPITGPRTTKITEHEIEGTENIETISFGGFGPKPVHVPVKIPPKKSRPVRDSDEQPSRFNLGFRLSDIVDDLLDELFE